MAVIWCRIRFTRKQFSFGAHDFCILYVDFIPTSLTRFQRGHQVREFIRETMTVRVRLSLWVGPSQIS